MTLGGLYILALGVAWIAQKAIHNKYGIDFNDERKELGVYPINDFRDIKNDYWNDFSPDFPLTRWTAILTNKEIGNSTTYTNPDRSDKPFRKRKTVFYGTQLCFWQNYYGGEIDLCIKPIDDIRHIELFVVYYSDNIEPKNYFYADLDTVRKNQQEFICGTPLEDKYSIPKGNLTKLQADKLLIEWKLR